MSYDADLEEKEEFFATVMDAIIAAGYPNPGYYIDDHYGEPCIFGPDNTPKRSVAGDSPIGILRDFVKVIDADGY